MEAALRTREPELVALRRLAEELAGRRSQKPTTTHLLAAIASREGQAASLLLERRLDPEEILRAARVTVDDSRDALARALQKARELAKRNVGRFDANGKLVEPNAIHVLYALCQESGTAAHRAMVQCGTDVTRLRTMAMQLAMGIAPPRRDARRAPTASGESVAILPPSRARSRRQDAREAGEGS
jgi:ATP-dependent Clp protease ATP-binding subunit ClpC